MIGAELFLEGGRGQDPDEDWVDCAHEGSQYKYEAWKSLQCLHPRFCEYQGLEYTGFLKKRKIILMIYFTTLVLFADFNGIEKQMNTNVTSPLWTK